MKAEGISTGKILITILTTLLYVYKKFRKFTETNYVSDSL